MSLRVGILIRPAETVATIVSTFISISIVNWQMTGVKDLCSVDQPQKFTCPGINTFFTAAVLWGTIGSHPRRAAVRVLTYLPGPKRVFGIGALYNNVLWAFLIGLFVRCSYRRRVVAEPAAKLPIPVYFYVKKHSNTWVRYIHVPAILYGMIGGSPYNVCA